MVVENVYRLMSEHRGARLDRKALVIQAVKEVGQPVIFGILIIIIVFLPILSLEGMEGKMFHPLAYTIMIALLVSLILSLTLSPVLCSLVMKQGSEEDTFLIRWTKRIYLPTLRWALGHRVAVLAIAIGLLVASLLLFPFLGGEFIPILNEAALTPQTIRLPSISLQKSIEIEKDMQKAVLEFPENQQAPIAAQLDLRTEAGVSIQAEFDFRQTGEQTWDIELLATDGRLRLSQGGGVLEIDGKPVAADDALAGEYPRLYARFAEMCAAGTSEVDWRPFQLVADAFLIGERRTVAAHHV